MPTFITGGPARVTITPLGPAGPVGGLVILGLAVGLADRYAHTIMQAVEIVVVVAFAAVVAAVVTVVVLMVRRILAELRPARRAKLAVPAAADTTAGQLRGRAAAAIEPGPVVDVKPEWIIPREAAR